MSRIYFHAEDYEAAVSGAERHQFGRTCARIAWSVLGSIVDEWGDKRSLLRNVFPPDHYVLQSDNFPRVSEMFFSVGSDMVRLGDIQIDPFAVNLNTAYFMGSKPVRLAARLHGQCEIHAYVEAENRQWLADIIRQGRKFKFFRDAMGWESVIDLLEKNNNGPVVTSFSVSDPFPNGGIANFEYPVLGDGETDWAAWDDLAVDRQWEMAMNGLRQSGGGVELKPDNWDIFYFTDGIDANLLVARLQRMDERNG